MSVRQGIKSRTAQVAIAAVIGAYIFGVYLAARPARPKFKVGDCVQMNRVHEDWDKTVDPVKNVARIGKQNYLFVDGSDTPFSFQSIYKKVPCK